MEKVRFAVIYPCRQRFQDALPITAQIDSRKGRNHNAIFESFLGVSRHLVEHSQPHRYRNSNQFVLPVESN
jgi:hypothetical protein